MTDAQAIGVHAPERVRLLALARVPMPGDLTLRTAAAAIQFLTPDTRGLALRYGIFVRSDCWGERATGRARTRRTPRNMSGSAASGLSCGNTFWSA